MPRDVKELRATPQATNQVNGQAKEVLDFLALDPRKAFSLLEISQGISGAQDLRGPLAFDPWLAGIRTWNLATALEDLKRRDLVVMGLNGGPTPYYSLSGRARAFGWALKAR